MENLKDLVINLCKYKNELPWLEFKHNNYDPEMIGKDISALANSAAIKGRDYAYFLWGIEDGAHSVVGTKYNLQSLKKGNEELVNWLHRLLSENADFEYMPVEIDAKDVGILKIHCAVNHPVSFRNCEYIRVGSYTKRLIDFPALQSSLWEQLNSRKFEQCIAEESLTLPDVMNLLDFRIYFDLTGIPQPSSIDGIAHYMLEEKVLLKQDDGLYSITNLGAILFAKHLNRFSKLERKAMRIVQYEGNNRIHMLKDHTVNSGYAVGFENALEFIKALVPSQEVINGALRETIFAFPISAVREVVANALIHQDFSVRGTGVTIEIFSNRLDVTNPGVPLIDIHRIIDNPPKSRNEGLASMMRRLRMCEELGTGWDKITIACEQNQLPAPRIEVYEENTKVTLYTKIPYAGLSMNDRLWACYLHACILYVQDEQLTNRSLRARFGVPDSSSGSISRLIKAAVAEKLIKPLDPNTSNKYMRYVPIWA